MGFPMQSCERCLAAYLFLHCCMCQEARAAVEVAQARAERATAAKQMYKEQAVSLARQLGQRMRAAELAAPLPGSGHSEDDAYEVGRRGSQ